MNKNDLIQAFFPELIKNNDNHQINETRMEQYKRIFDEKEMENLSQYINADTQAIDEDALSDTYTNLMLTKLLNNNSCFDNVKDNISVTYVKSDAEKTCCFIYNDIKVILFDKNTMKFLWMLNKAFVLCEEQHYPKEEQIQLFVSIILHFATTRNPQKGVFSQPLTPPHTSKESFKALTTIVEAQESFMLAHEMAHIILDKNLAIKEYRNFVLENLTLITDDIDANSVAAICQELDADRIAFEAILNAYQDEGEKKTVFIFMSSAVFLLIRYNLWYNISGDDIFSDDDSFNIWFIRNAFFRKLVDLKYEWGVAVHIIYLLESLEESFEPAAMIASKIIKEQFTK